MTEERGPIYGVPLMKSVPLGDTGMMQALPSRKDLERLQQFDERAAAAIEVLLSHYRQHAGYGEDAEQRIDPLRAMLRDSHAGEKLIAMAGLIRSMWIDDSCWEISDWCKWLHGLGEQISSAVD